MLNKWEPGETNLTSIKILISWHILFDTPSPNRHLIAGALGSASDEAYAHNGGVARSSHGDTGLGCSCVWISPVSISIGVNHIKTITRARKRPPLPWASISRYDPQRQLTHLRLAMRAVAIRSTQPTVGQQNCRNDTRRIRVELPSQLHKARARGIGFSLQAPIVADHSKLQPAALVKVQSPEPNTRCAEPKQPDARDSSGWKRGNSFEESATRHKTSQ